MTFYTNSYSQSQKIIQPFNSYDYSMNYPTGNSFTQETRYITTGTYETQNKSYTTPSMNLNNLNNLYFSNELADNSSNTVNNHSYYNYSNESKIMPTNYNTYYSNQTYQSPIQYTTENNIYPNNNMINHSNYTIFTEIENKFKNEDFAKVVPIETGYDSTSPHINDIISTKKETEIYYNSTEQVPNSNNEYNSYMNYQGQNEPQINFDDDTAFVTKIEDINDNINEITNTNINTQTKIITNETNILSQVNDKKVDIQYINQKKVLDNNIINSPKSYEENLKPPVYHSYISKSPDITLKMNLFSPIQSPLANYETQSYNSEDNFDINEMLKSKEENELYKQQLKELDIYKEKAAEARELRMQIEQLSPLKEKLSEISSLKAQLRDLNELKAKIAQLEKFGLQLQQKEDIEQEQDIKISNQKQDIQFKPKNTIKLKKAPNKKIINQSKNEKKIKTKNSNFELNDDNEPEFVKGEIIHNIKELGMIIKNINTEGQQVILNLLYKASSDSDRAEVFHKKCDKAKSTLVLIETDKGKRFGGYTSVNWKGKGIKKKDREAFVFSLDNMKVYENIIGEKAIGCYPKFGPIFLGCQIRIYDHAFEKGGSTFKKRLNFNTDEDYVLNGGERLFKIKEIEVYEVIAQ